MTKRVAIVGASGRMGQVAVRLIEAAKDLELHATIAHGDDLDAMLGADVVLDFTLPQSSQTVVEHAVAAGISTVTGTSGWGKQRVASIGALVAAKPGVGVLIVPNFSIGSVLASSFAATAAKYFDSIEIVEAHHPAKVDSPSGTAVRTAELIGEARAALGPVIAPHVDQRARGQQVASVPIHSMRMQGVLAKQDVIFGGNGEVVTISHLTMSSSAYEAGILLALRAVGDIEGVVVGLDSLLDLQS